MAIPAFTKKYFVPYQVHGGAKREIQIFANGYSGEPIEWKGGATPWKVDKGNTDDLFGDLIVSSVATIEVILEERFDFTEFIESRQSHLVNLVDTDSDTVMWSGWVEPHNGNSPYSKPPHKLTFKASCGLAQLKRIKWQQSVSEPIKKPVIEIVRRCLALTGHSLNLNTSVFAKELVMPEGDPLAGYRHNTNRYYDGTERLYAYDILLDILEKHNSEIFQERNEWVIRSLPDQTRGYTDKRRYSPSGASLGTASQNLFYRINTYKALSLSTGTRSALRPIKKWTASADLLPYTNPFDNGDLRGWDGTTFPGWDMSLMDGYWSKYDTGNPKTPFAIKITGLKFLNEIIRLKKNFWGRTWLTKTEPSRYISPNPLEFNPQEEKTVITIPYRAEARQQPEKVTFIASVHTRRANGTDELWLQEDGKWGKTWGNVYFSGASGLVDKEPIEARIEVDTKSLNVVKNWVPSSQLPSPYEFLYVRIYQLIAPPGYPGADTVELKIYGIYTDKVDPVITGPTSVSYTLNSNSTVEDDSRTVQLLTAEMHGTHLTGIPLDLNQEANTASWSRPGFTDERKSLLGLMVSERLAMTTPALKVTTCDITVLPDQEEPRYENFLIFDDAGEEKFKIVRYSYIDHSRTVSITAVELKYDVPGNVTGISVIGDKTSYDNTGNGEISEGIESSTGTGTPIEEGVEGDKVVLDTENIIIEFVVAEENEEVVNLLEVLGLDEEDLENLSFSVISKPLWVIVDMGGDGQWTVSGIPPLSGSYTVSYTITDPVGTISNGKIIISVEPSEDFIESWPPKFVDVPPLYFIAGKTATRELDLTEYLDPEGEHDGTGLSPRLLSTPYWVSDSRIVFMGLSVTGLPDKPGTYWVTYEISDIIGRTTTVAFQVIVLDPSFMTYELLDTSLTTPVVIGNLPGVYELPERWDVAVRVKGDHDKYHIFLKGGGANADVVNQDVQQLVPENNDGNYRFFEEDNGVVTEAGQFSLSADTYLANNFIFGETIDFVLYDQEFLDAIKFFLTQGATVLGEIVQDGTSSFIDPVTGNFGIEIEGIEHDKAVIEFDLVDPVAVEHTTPEVDFTYTFADEDFPISVGQHTVTITLYLDDVKVATRYAKFETVADKPKPVAGLKLISVIPNTADYSVIGELPEVGGSFELPANWNVLSDAESAAYDYEKAELWELRGGGLVEINTTVYTRQPDYNTFVAPVTKSEFFLFRELNSTKIGDVHSTPSTFRALFTRRIGGATGQIVAILKSDFSFGDAVDIEDTPIKQPGTDVVDVVAGAAMSESVVSFIKTLDVRVDNATIEIFNPNNPLQNWLRVKNKSIDMDKLIDITGPALIGRTVAGVGGLGSVPIVSTLTGASNSTIPTSLAVKTELDALNAVSTWGNVMLKGSISAVKPTVRIGAATTVTVYQEWSPTDHGAGKPEVRLVKNADPLVWELQLWDTVVVGGTLNLRATNLQHNGVQLVRETRQVIAGTGLTGGGPLDTDRTFSVVFGTIAGTVAQGNHAHADATTSVSGFMSAADKIKLNNIATGGDTWGAVMVRGASSSIAPVVVIGNASTTNVYQTWNVTDFGAGKPQVRLVKNVDPLTWELQLWDSVGMTGVLNIRSANLQHNGVRVVTEARQVLAGTGLTGGGPLNTDRTISVVFGTTAGTASEGNHVHAVVTTSANGFMSAADKVKLNNLPSTADTWQTVMARGATSSIAPVVSIGNASTINVFQSWRPTDHGVNRPEVRLVKGSDQLTWELQLWDTSSMSGVLNVRANGLHHNGVQLVREDRQINTGTGLNGGGPLDTNRTISVNFGTTGGTVAEGNHTHVAAQITDFVSVSRNAISGVGNINYNPATGVISYTGGSGSGTVGGNGTAGYFTKWSTGGVNIQDTTVRDTGTEIEFANNRSVGVLGIMAVRNDFNVWKDMSLGHTNSHGTLFIHNDSTATILGSAAFEIRSTTKAAYLPRMTRAQKKAIVSPQNGATIWQTTGDTESFVGLKVFHNNLWWRIPMELDDTHGS